MPLRAKNCWEVMSCGREPNGSRVAELGVCPAATHREADGLNRGRNAGRICWAVSGTFCGGEVQGTFAEKQLSCLNCRFLKQVEAEEGSYFTLLIPGKAFRRRSDEELRA